MADVEVSINGGTFPPTIKFDVKGVKGTGCVGLTDELQKIVGAATAHQTLKPEYKEVKQKLTARR